MSCDFNNNEPPLNLPSELYFMPSDLQSADTGQPHWRALQANTRSLSLKAKARGKPDLLLGP